MNIIKCDQKDCGYNEDGECVAAMVAIVRQECMTYSCADIDYEEDK